MPSSSAQVVVWVRWKDGNAERFEKVGDTSGFSMTPPRSQQNIIEWVDYHFCDSLHMETVWTAGARRNRNGRCVNLWSRHIFGKHIEKHSSHRLNLVKWHICWSFSKKKRNNIESIFSKNQSLIGYTRRINRNLYHRIATSINLKE